MKLKINFSTLSQGLFWYFLGITGVIYSGNRVISAVKYLEPPPAVSTTAFFVWFAFAMATFLLLFHFLRRRWFLETLFSLALFSGAWFLLDTLVPGGFALPLAILVIILRESVRRVAIHNLVVTIGVAGIAASIGLSFTSTAAILILVIFSIYDIVAVYVTRHMVKLFTGLLREHVILALVLPENLKNNLAPIDKIRPGAGFFLLGTGDLVLPLLFLASTLMFGSRVTIFTALGIFAGFILTYFIFISQKSRPMPALPPLTVGTLLGFVLGTIFG